MCKQNKISPDWISDDDDFTVPCRGSAAPCLQHIERAQNAPDWISNYFFPFYANF